MLGYLFFVASVGVLCGLFRVRGLVIVAAVLLLAWPTIYGIRDDLREDRGVAVSQEVSAADQLRVDVQLAQVAAIDVPVDLRQPGPADYLRYGLLPRQLDPDRPPITTGSDINQFLGGSANSSYNFLTLGNVYFFGGPLGVVIFYVCWALVAVVLLRWRQAPGPARLSLLCFAMGGPLLWSSSYPDTMIAFIQYTVSALPVFAVLFATRMPGRVQADRRDRSLDQGGVSTRPAR
ncbi:hypothetical protein [Micromonospora sp. NPDC093277]|uniref:hypothetical protein n=1 Tax=Micromonospora sp. NPDC093277 TaxID=3364291 RepID=UPI003818C3B9